MDRTSISVAMPPSHATQHHQPQTPGGVVVSNSALLTRVGTMRWDGMGSIRNLGSMGTIQGGGGRGGGDHAWLAGVKEETKAMVPRPRNDGPRFHLPSVDPKMDAMKTPTRIEKEYRRPYVLSSSTQSNERDVSWIREGSGPVEQGNPGRHGNHQPKGGRTLGRTKPHVHASVRLEKGGRNTSIVPRKHIQRTLRNQRASNNTEANMEFQALHATLNTQPTVENQTKTDWQTRIVGGTPVIPADRYEWMVSLACVQGNTYTTFCGGTLVDQRHVLSAAHCDPRLPDLCPGLPVIAILT